LAESYFKKYEVKYGTEAIGRVSLPPKPDKADYHRVDIEGLEVEDVRTFGGEHLCHQTLEKLQLEECLLSSKEADKALISIAARALFASSEHKTANYNTVLVLMKPFHTEHFTVHLTRFTNIKAR